MTLWFFQDTLPWGKTEQRNSNRAIAEIANTVKNIAQWNTPCYKHQPGKLSYATSDMESTVQDIMMKYYRFVCSILCRVFALAWREQMEIICKIFSSSESGRVLWKDELPLSIYNFLFGIFLQSKTNKFGLSWATLSSRYASLASWGHLPSRLYSLGSSSFEFVFILGCLHLR